MLNTLYQTIKIELIHINSIPVNDVYFVIDGELIKWHKVTGEVSTVKVL